MPPVRYLEVGTDLPRPEAPKGATSRLVSKKLVSPEEAYSKAVDKAGFEAAVKRLGISVASKPQAPVAAGA